MYEFVEERVEAGGLVHCQFNSDRLAVRLKCAVMVHFD